MLIRKMCAWRDTIDYFQWQETLFYCANASNGLGFPEVQKIWKAAENARVYQANV